MCWFCDDIKRFINKRVVVYDNATTNASKEYCHFYSDDVVVYDTVTLKITAGGYRGNSHILTGMRELNGLKYCPNCGEKIEDFDNCASKENDKISYEIEELKKDFDNLRFEEKDFLAEGYLENKRKLYKNLKANRRWAMAQLDHDCCSIKDLDLFIHRLYFIDRQINKIESSKIFKYIKED